MDIECRAILDNGMASIVTTLRSAAQLHAVAQHIDNLAFALVTPLRAQNYRRHRCRRSIARGACGEILRESPF